MNEKDDIDTGVEDKNTPNIRLSDTEIGEALKRLCQKKDIRESIYTAVEQRKKMSRDLWKYHFIQGLITTVAVVLSIIFGKFFL